MRWIFSHFFNLFVVTAGLCWGTEVAVLGYHELVADGEEATEMRLPVGQFRQQMQRLSAEGVEVVGMERFLAWKRGEAELPEKAAVITFDDGWQSVYTLAFPILREYGYPFTLFLYTDYVEVGGRSMSRVMIDEMIAAGAMVANHSKSHPYPRQVREKSRLGRGEFRKWLREEMGESQMRLREWFGQAVLPAYAYPGGFHLSAMKELGDELGYQAMFTVIPEFVRFDSEDFALPRFVVLGTHPESFERALRFGKAQSEGSYPKFSPADRAQVSDRRPQIEVVFAPDEEVVADSVELVVGELGKVEVTWDPLTRRVMHKVELPLRAKVVEIELTYRVKVPLDESLVIPDLEQAGEKVLPAAETELRRLVWQFSIDHELHYVPVSEIEKHGVGLGDEGKFVPVEATPPGP